MTLRYMRISGDMLRDLGRLLLELFPYYGQGA
jgi:hypothetical protein